LTGASIFEFLFQTRKRDMDVRAGMVNDTGAAAPKGIG
jgi:hypothetical protein